MATKKSAVTKKVAKQATPKKKTDVKEFTGDDPRIAQTSRTGTGTKKAKK